MMNQILRRNKIVNNSAKALTFGDKGCCVTRLMRFL